MAQTSVAQFATQLKMQAGALLEQLNRAGVTKSEADDLLSEQDKSRLLEYLRRSHGGEAKTKITLTRRETSEIRSQDSHGKSHTVQVEVRKKRVLVKREPTEARAAAAVQPPVAAAAAGVGEEMAEAVLAPVFEPVVADNATPVLVAAVEPVDRAGCRGKSRASARSARRSAHRDAGRSGA
jgi:translation initiation factor IF-2